MNFFAAIGASLKTIGDLEADVAAEATGHTPDYGPLANDVLTFSQGKFKVPERVTPERLTKLFDALHQVVQAVLAFFEPVTPA